MIIYKCDLCNKEVRRIDTLVLYKHTIDYCEECRVKAKVIRNAMKHSIDFYKEEANKNIEQAEQNILDKYVRNRTKCSVKLKRSTNSIEINSNKV
jgi:hypothetical protein